MNKKSSKSLKMLKILGVVLIAGVIMTFGSEIGERISLPGGSAFGVDGRSQSRASADPGERCRGGPPDDAAHYPSIDDIQGEVANGLHDRGHRRGNAATMWWDLLPALQ